MITLLLHPTHPPFTPSITLRDAVAFNVANRSNGKPLDAVAFMLALLLEDLTDKGVLGAPDLARILDLEITGIEVMEQMPPFLEELP